MKPVDPEKTYQEVLTYQKETAHLGGALSLLGWDQRTHIPLSGHAGRAEQIGALVRVLHQRGTNPELGEKLAALAEWQAGATETVNIREWHRDYQRQVQIPEALAVELAQASSASGSAWEVARPKNDWASFAPHLAKVIELTRERAAILADGGSPYDALLEDYEPGANQKELQEIFTPLRAGLVQLLAKIRASNREFQSLLGNYPVAAQDEFGREVLRSLGYDFNQGRLDPTAHPFSTGIGPGDVRITTHYYQEDFASALFSSVHEMGHALYELGLPAEHYGTPCGEAVSLGIHESQSRSWENLVGRSLGFWRHFYPMAQRYFPSLNLSLADFYAAINQVSPGLIRIEADEVTYNLHILVRFELEPQIIAGSLTVANIPEAWNAAYQANLGITPPDYAAGVMQDVHWSEGSFGYFPTYTLGNLYGAQFFAAAQHQLGDLEEAFARGEFAPFLAWLRTNIHSQGRRLPAVELVKQVTGQEPSPAALLEYLNQKYAPIYGF